MTTTCPTSARTIEHLSAERPSWPYGVDPTAPSEAWAVGNVELLAEAHRAVALVGARACTAYGETMACDFARGIIQGDRPIITDLGFGIAAAATRAALAQAAPEIPARVIVQAPIHVDRIHPHPQTDRRIEVIAWSERPRSHRDLSRHGGH